MPDRNPVAHRWLLVLTAGSALGLPGAASRADDAVALPTITVQAGAEDSSRIGAGAEGEYLLDRRHLDEFGAANGSLTESLQNQPNLHYSEGRYSPESLYDLRPQSISISGGRYYENSFLIDGLSVDSRLDPAGNVSDTSLDDVPGHEQALFLDLDMIESVRVFDSNVPAAYGRFTGGVVEAETRRAGAERETRLHYSTTRSDWVDYHLFLYEDPLDPQPAAPPEPPVFERTRLGISHATPIGKDSGLWASLQYSTSTTPTLSLNRSEQLRQEQMGASAKFSTRWAEYAYLDTTLSYAPYTKQALIEDAKDSRFTLQGGGIQLGTTATLYSGPVKHKIKLGANYSENSRQAPKDFFNWANTPSRDWGLQADISRSREGGFGDLDKYQAGLSAAWEAVREDLDLHGLPLRLDYGAELRYSRLGFERPEPLYIYQEAVVNTQVQCRGNDYDCVQGEQYFSQRNVYPADEVSVDLLESALYAEATVDVGRLRATAGLRYDYDDFLKNHNLAWRTRGRLDVFGNGGTQLIAGYNRYYGGALLTYKLREARAPYYQEYRGTTHNVVNDWEPDSGQGSYRYVFDEVRTPYSDEYTFAVKQHLWGGLAELKLLARAYRDEFSRTTTQTQPDGYRYYLMNNEGSTDYKSISLAWDRRYGSMTLGVYASYSETETRNADYDDPVDPIASDEYVWYDGRRLHYGELEILRQDYARPWVVGAYLSRRFGQRLLASVQTRYRSSYETIVETSRTVPGELIELPGGGIARETLTVYETRRLPSTWITDLKLAWRIPLAEQADLRLELQVNNLFDARTHTVAEDESGVEIGRNFWLGAQARF